MNKKLLAELKQLLLQNSWTHNPEGVDKVGYLVMDLLKEVDLDWKFAKSAKRGDLFVAKAKEYDPSRPRVLLVGHIDTVFPENWEMHKEGDKFYGPGSLDMKAGVLSMIEIIRQLDRENKLVNLTALFTPDEEEGMEHINTQKEIYKQADYALVFEEGTYNHQKINPKERAIVIQRKAVGFYTVTFSGPGGHNASLDKENLRHSAIDEMSRVILDLHKLCDFEKGTLVNVGLAKGGISPNSLAEEAQIRIDIRYGNKEEEDRVEKELEKIFVPQDKQIKIVGTKTLHYPSFESTPEIEEFAEMVIEVGKELGLNINKQRRSSGSEANWIAHYHPECKLLDGFGVIGKGDHSKNEHFYLSSFNDSVKLGKNVIKKILQFSPDGV